MKLRAFRDKVENNKIFWWTLIFLIAISIRILLSMIYATKVNGDFEAYCIVGDLAAQGKNVYAHTIRYNYAPLWSVILGKFYAASQLFTNSRTIYKIFIVLFITLADLGIARIIARQIGELWGMIFFINPISMASSIFYPQFDNTAVFLGACGILFLCESSKQTEIKLYDIAGIVFLSLSLLMKHILYAFPLWILLNKNINIRKKILYAFIPPLVFLLSFVPYWPEGSQGIINNVFMYRSASNYPLFALELINHLGIYLPMQKYIGFPVFNLLMLLAAYIFRNEELNNSFMLYTISLVCFTSSLWHYYLSIPCMAIVVLFSGKSIFYFVLIIFRWVNKSLLSCIMVWCLLFYLVDYCKHKKALNML